MKKCLFIAGLSLITQSAIAWPLFTTPNWQQLKQAGAVNQHACPAGYAKIRANASIPVTLVNQLPSVKWHWETRHSSACFKQAAPLPFVSYDILTEYDPIEHYALKSTITALFINAQAKSFEMSITTPKQHWYCHVEKSAPTFVSCANDI